jgi:hypothetical protein
MVLHPYLHLPFKTFRKLCDLRSKVTGRKIEVETLYIRTEYDDALIQHKKAHALSKKYSILKYIIVYQNFLRSQTHRT